MLRSPRGLPIKLACQECKCTFTVMPYLAKLRKYCSAKCKQTACGRNLSGSNHPLYRHDVKFRPCKFCGTSFRPKVSNTERGKGVFCSLKCYWKSMERREKVHCSACGKEFYCVPNRIRDHEQLFCSNKCKFKVIKGKRFEKGETPWFIERGLPHPGIISRRPNKPEKKLIEIIRRHSFPFSYVGNGRAWILDKNPDFISINQEKKLIEVFGDYWHTKKVRKPEDTEKGRVKFFRDCGFEALVIWEHELSSEKEVVQKIENFVVR